LWGSYGSKNFHSVHATYHENEEKYERLCSLKRRVDPKHVLTPNAFCVGKTPYDSIPDPPPTPKPSPSEELPDNILRELKKPFTEIQNKLGSWVGANIGPFIQSVPGLDEDQTWDEMKLNVRGYNIPRLSVYWASRDVNSIQIGHVQNRHLILLCGHPMDFLGEKIECDVEDGVFFATISAVVTNNRLIVQFNAKEDVQSIREMVDPNEHTTWLKNYDLQRNLVPPNQNVTQEQFFKMVIEAALNYKNNQDKAPQRTDLNEWSSVNAWVNTLFKKVGISDSERKKLGDFVGWDKGSGEIINLNLFYKPTVSLL
jgi:hypothetical protein